MNPEIKAQWLAALRSGEYEQGQEALVNIDADGKKTYCCLGVLCDVVVRERLIEVDVEERPHRVEFDREASSLPPRVWQFVGLPDENPFVVWGVPAGPEVGPDLKAFTLAELNDGMPTFDLRPHTFNEIADLIEREL